MNSNKINPLTTQHPVSGTSRGWVCSVLAGFALSAILSFFSITALHAQTEVSCEVSGEWTAEDSPYIVVDSTWVPEDERLTIEPGVEVVFDGCGLYVAGMLVAEGTENDSIRFIQGEDEVGGRRILVSGEEAEIVMSYCFHDGGLGTGLKMDSDATAEVNYSRIIGQAAAITVGTGAYCDTYSTSIIKTESGLWGAVLVSNGSFRGIECEIYGALNEENEFVRSTYVGMGGRLTLERTSTYGYMDNGDGSLVRFIDCDMTSCSIGGRAEVRNCTIEGHFGGGYCHDIQVIDNEIGGYISFWGLLSGTFIRINVEGDFIGRSIYRNQDTIRIFNSKIGGTLECIGHGGFFIDSCVIGQNVITVEDIARLEMSRCEIGGYIDHGARRTIALENNTIYSHNIDGAEHNIALKMDNVSNQSNIVLKNNIIYLPDCDDETSLMKIPEFNRVPNYINYNCFYGMDRLIYDPEDFWEDQFELDETNIYSNPLFVSIDTLNLNLAEDSPCIDAGDPDSPRDPDGTIADMGAYCYDHDNQIGFLDPAFDPFNINLKMYPNPVNSALNVQYTLHRIDYTILEVFDSTGRKIIVQSNGYHSPGNYNHTLEVYGLSAGTYFVRMATQNGVFQNKFILVK